MIVGSVLLILVAIAWLDFLWSRRKFYMCALKMKGPLGYPFIGMIYKMYKMGGFVRVLRYYAEVYKTKTYFSWLGPFPMIYTSDPMVAEKVLQSPDCLNKSAAYFAFDDAIGNGLLTSKTPKWNKHRKLLNPYFGNRVLLRLIPAFNKSARDTCAEMDKLVGCGEVDIKELALKMVLRSSVATTMGSDVEEDARSESMKSFERILDFIFYRMTRPWSKSITLFSMSSAFRPFLETRTTIRTCIQDLVKSKLKMLEDDIVSSSYQDWDDKEKDHPVFIDQAIKLHKQDALAVGDVIDETIVTVMAAYETTGSAIYSTLMFLAMHPEIQERVFEEMSTLFEDREFDVTYDDLKNMKYLQMCINETMRLTASVPLIGRVCVRDLRISEDITMPAGGEIYIDIFSIHRDEDIWGPTAKTYNPDHFLPSNLEGKHKCAFMPFSKGKRNCMGWQYAEMFMKVMLSQVLLKYKFSTSFRYEDVKFEPLISVKFVSTPNLEVHRR